MKLTVSDTSVPAGTYVGQFAGVETKKHKEYGDGLCWKFRITQGPQTGKTALRFTGPTPSPNSACGRLVSGLVGRPLELDEEIDFDSFVGRAYLIVIEPAPTDGLMRVAGVSPLPTV
jgi:hypothetical protein